MHPSADRQFCEHSASGDSGDRHPSRRLDCGESGDVSRRGGDACRAATPSGFAEQTLQSAAAAGFSNSQNPHSHDGGGEATCLDRHVCGLRSTGDTTSAAPGDTAAPPGGISGDSHDVSGDAAEQGDATASRSTGLPHGSEPALGGGGDTGARTGGGRLSLCCGCGDPIDRSDACHPASQCDVSQRALAAFRAAAGGDCRLRCALSSGPAPLPAARQPTRAASADGARRCAPALSRSRPSTQGVVGEPGVVQCSRRRPPPRRR
eukprot:TRINITY_DN2495_c0_g1_i3.p2 TRINITY_DN2495_c0_g1~~TRINITY_DN2495_c0_g1_i3.p2  ORF type:complete len:263 (-),score=77.31 TRINITY_DN2495_c0_g1_i3:573-1361(-)